MEYPLAGSAITMKTVMSGYLIPQNKYMDLDGFCCDT